MSDETQSPPQSGISARELKERSELIGKLMLLYPPRQDAEASLKAYIEETADIPVAWLREGLRGFRDDGGRVFLPAISEVRAAVAKEYLNVKRDILGICGHEPVAQKAINVGSVIRRMSIVAPNGYAQLAASLAQLKDSPSVQAIRQNVAAVQADADLSEPQKRGELTRLTLESIEKMIAADGLTPQLRRRQHERQRQHRHR